MSRRITQVARPVIHTPTKLDWTREKLAALSEEQLLTLLDNLDHQLAIGRLPHAQAAELDLQITSLLPARATAKRRKRAAAAKRAETASAAAAGDTSL